MTAPLFSTAVVDKARRLVDDGRVAAHDATSSVWTVEGDHGTYLVAYARMLTGDVAVCSCPAGKSVVIGPATCSHVAAVLLTCRDGEVSA